MFVRPFWRKCSHYSLAISPALLTSLTGKCRLCLGGTSPCLGCSVSLGPLLIDPCHPQARPQVLPRLAFSEEWPETSGQAAMGGRQAEDTYPEGSWTKESPACLAGEAAPSWGGLQAPAAQSRAQPGYADIAWLAVSGQSRDTSLF